MNAECVFVQQGSRLRFDIHVKKVARLDVGSEIGKRGIRHTLHGDIDMPRTGRVGGFLKGIRVMKYKERRHGADDGRAVSPEREECFQNNNSF